MKTFLKFYIWIYLIMVLFGLVSLVKIDYPTLHVTRNVIISILSPTCVFLYAYNKRWLPDYFWKIYFFFYLADTIYDFVAGRLRGQFSSPSAYYLTSLISLIILVPVIIAIYRYAFKKGN
jgi:hypothetical protein